MSEKRSHAEILKELLESKNMRVIELARLAELPPTTIYSMIRRNNRKTEPETLAKISKALNIPISFWNDFSNEERVLRSHDLSSGAEDETIPPNVFYETISLNNVSLEYICYALQVFGYSYSTELLKQTIDEQIPVSRPVATIIKNAMLAAPMIKFKDYEFVQDFNSLSKQSRSLIEEMMIVLHKSELYEDKQLDKMIKEIHKQKDE